jgi:hypothetical protein
MQSVGKGGLNYLSTEVVDRAGSVRTLALQNAVPETLGELRIDKKRESRV